VSEETYRMDPQEKNLRDLQKAAAIIDLWQRSEHKDSGYLSNVGKLPSSGTNSEEKDDMVIDADKFVSVNRRLSMPHLRSFETKDDDSVFIEAGLSPLAEENKPVLRTSMMNHPESSDEEEKLIRSTQKKHRAMNKHKRVVLKDGLTTVTYKNISKKRRRYFSDLYTTLLDSSWTYCVLLFAASFYGSWLVFGILYYFIAYAHGDLDVEHSTQPKDWMPCILMVDSFSSAFLFSLETQHTIGYGGRQTTTKCPDAIILVSLQAVLGCIIQAFMVGLVFSKLSRPRNRSKTVIFSTHACIMQRDKKLCLVIRIGDLRDDNFILGTSISVKILRRKVTEEGELYHDMKMIKVEPDVSKESCVFFVWPLDIVHVIDEESPFYNMTASDLAKERFELLVVLEGTNETSNMNFQARTSYLPSEILWGHRFESMLLYRKEHKKFQVNFSAFHSTYEVDTPICSAKTLEKFHESNQKRQVPRMTRRPHSMINNLGQLYVDQKHRLVRQQTLPEYFDESPTMRSRSNSNTANSSRNQSLRKQKSINTISPRVSSALDKSQVANEKVRWMLGAPVTSPGGNSPTPQPLTNTQDQNASDNHNNNEMFLEEASESSVDSANATEAKRIQSMKYSKL